jgi:hypothetical protein
MEDSALPESKCVSLAADRMVITTNRTHQPPRSGTTRIPELDTRERRKQPERRPDAVWNVSLQFKPLQLAHPSEECQRRQVLTRREPQRGWLHGVVNDKFGGQAAAAFPSS